MAFSSGEYFGRWARVMFGGTRRSFAPVRRHRQPAAAGRKHWRPWSVAIHKKYHFNGAYRQGSAAATYGWCVPFADIISIFVTPSQRRGRAPARAPSSRHRHLRLRPRLASCRPARKSDRSGSQRQTNHTQRPRRKAGLVAALTVEPGMRNRVAFSIARTQRAFATALQRASTVVSHRVV